MRWKDLLTGQWRGPDVLLTTGLRFACVFPQDADSQLWEPDPLIQACGKPSSSVPEPAFELDYVPAL